MDDREKAYVEVLKQIENNYKQEKKFSRLYYLICAMFIITCLIYIFITIQYFGN